MMLGQPILRDPVIWVAKWDIHIPLLVFLMLNFINWWSISHCRSTWWVPKWLITFCYNFVKPFEILSCHLVIMCIWMILLYFPKLNLGICVIYIYEITAPVFIQECTATQRWSHLCYLYLWCHSTCVYPGVYRETAMKS